MVWRILLAIWLTCVFSMGSSVNALAAPANASVESSVLSNVEQELGALKSAGYLIILLAAAAGLSVYFHRHQRLQPWDLAAGLSVTGILAITLFWGAESLLIKESGKGCLINELAVEVNRADYIDTCRETRETVANLVGIKSVWQLFDSQKIENGRTVPMPPRLVILLTYFSVLISAWAMFVIFKIPVKRLSNKSIGR